MAEKCRGTGGGKWGESLKFENGIENLPFWRFRCHFQFLNRFPETGGFRFFNKSMHWPMLPVFLFFPPISLPLVQPKLMAQKENGAILKIQFFRELCKLLRITVRRKRPFDLGIIIYTVPGNWFII